MKLIASIFVALTLTGCAHEYQAYADIHKAKAQAEADAILNTPAAPGETP